MQLQKKLCKIKANLKYKLAGSFCRNFALQSNQEILLKQYLQSPLSQKKWIRVDEKIHSTFFVKQKNEIVQILAGRSHEVQWSSDVNGHK